SAGQVIVLDFGLVAELDRTALSGRSERVAGTPRYMAPEQATGSPVTPANDWYAVGVMLYEALSGKPPFKGSSFWELLQNKQRFDPPPLPKEPATVADLSALCMQLLARDPEQRPDALAITKAIAVSSQPTAPVLASPGQHLVGREQHLAALED